jgi:tetratricopeptide (TPR) repeat protein
VLFRSGKINKDSKNYPAAIASFEKAQKDTKIRIKSLIEKGLCCMLNNNTESAVSELERVIRLSKEATEGEILNARYFLSACYEKDRKIINAVEQWEAIYEKKPNFKDVGQKLGQYQEIRGDDSMKDFFTASNEKFMDMCIKILENRGYNERERKTIKGGCQIIVVERTTGNWKNLKIQPTLVNFYRIPDPVDEPEFRTFTEDMKKLNIIKGIIFSTSDFTRKALSFIENRPVNTVKKEQLQEELKKINN